MAESTNINKVVYNGTTLIDLTADTVDASHLAKGYTAHDLSGALITGEMSTNYYKIPAITADGSLRSTDSYNESFEIASCNIRSTFSDINRSGKLVAKLGWGHANNIFDITKESGRVFDPGVALTYSTSATYTNGIDTWTTFSGGGRPDYTERYLEADAVTIFFGLSANHWFSDGSLRTGYLTEISISATLNHYWADKDGNKITALSDEGGYRVKVYDPEIVFF